MATAVNLASVQDAIGNMLAADAAVTAALGSHLGRIQGADVADEVALPYVQIGDDEIRDVSVQFLTAKDVRLKVHIWTAERGFAQCKSIEAAVVALLDDAEITVPALRVVSIFHAVSNFMKDVNNGVRHGVAEFDLSVVPA